MPDWQAPSLALYMVTPPGAIRPARVQALMAFLVDKIAGSAWAKGVGMAVGQARRKG